MKFLPNSSLRVSLTVFFILSISPERHSADAGQLFRINKLNLIWNKAQHSLGQAKLKDLSNDLTKHEMDEITLKEMKAHNQDKGGAFELSVRKKLNTILTKYSLERYADDIAPKSTASQTNNESFDEREHSKLLKATFRDKKLDKLWKKAEQLGFTDEQLMILHEEFENHQSKLDEHYDLMEASSEDRNFKGKVNNVAENSIAIDTEARVSAGKRETESEKKHRLQSNYFQTVKERYSDVKKGIQDLHKKIMNGMNDGPFEEAAVNTLWAMALNSTLSQDDLGLFKSELEDFEIRIKKLKHFTNQLERSQLDREDDTETKHIRKRVSELSSKVEKTLRTLESKLDLDRQEL